MQRLFPWRLEETIGYEVRFHRNMYAGLPETKLLLPSQTHQAAWFRNNKFPFNFVLRWSVAESGSGRAAHNDPFTVQGANPRTSQGALLAVGWDYQTEETIHCNLENISGVTWLVMNAARNEC